MKSFKGMTPDDIDICINIWKNNRKHLSIASGLFVMFDELLTECVSTGRLAYEQLKREGDKDGARRVKLQLIKDKATLGDIHRLREEYIRAIDGSRIQDWFKRSRQHLMGLAQKRGADGGSKDVNG